VWRQIWSNNPQERLNREIRRRTDVVGIYPNRTSMLRLLGAVLAEQHHEWTEARRYIGLDVLAKCRGEQPDNTTNEEVPTMALTAKPALDDHEVPSPYTTSTGAARSGVPSIEPLRGRVVRGDRVAGVASQLVDPVEAGVARINGLLPAMWEAMAGSLRRPNGR
jgi:Transposase, Mutator family